MSQSGQRFIHTLLWLFFVHLLSRCLNMASAALGVRAWTEEVQELKWREASARGVRAWTGVAKVEELKWREAAAALHRQQEAYLKLLQRSAGLASKPSHGAQVDHAAALGAALVESREAHACTLRQAQEREIALEAQISEQVSKGWI